MVRRLQTILNDNDFIPRKLKNEIYYSRHDVFDLGKLAENDSDGVFASNSSEEREKIDTWKEVF